MTRRMLVFPLLLGVFVLVASAADVAGKWTAEVAAQEGQARQVTFNFRVEGDKLTGTMSGPGGELEILDGKISGDEISFAVSTKKGDQETKVLYRGKIEGNEIKLSSEADGKPLELTARRTQ